MEFFTGLEFRLMRIHNLKQVDIREAETYNSLYIGEKKYLILYNKNGERYNVMLPYAVCRDLQSRQIKARTVEMIGNIIEEREQIHVRDVNEYRGTSSKRKTRKELNKIKVRGYYDSIHN